MECGDGLYWEDQEICLLGLDVVALFPSMKSEQTGKIIRHTVMTSPIKIESINFSPDVGLLTSHNDGGVKLRQSQHSSSQSKTTPESLPKAPDEKDEKASKFTNEINFQRQYISIKGIRPNMKYIIKMGSISFDRIIFDSQRVADSDSKIQC